MEKRTSYRISISKMTNITTNLSSHFFGFFHGDLKKDNCSKGSGRKAKKETKPAKGGHIYKCSIFLQVYCK